MWFGLIVGAAMGGELVRSTRDGSLATHVGGGATPWIFVAGVGIVLMLAALAYPRTLEGLAACLAVGGAVAAFTRTQPAAALSLFGPLLTLAMVAAAASLLALCQHPPRRLRGVLPRPYSRAAIRARRDAPRPG